MCWRSADTRGRLRLQVLPHRRPAGVRHLWGAAAPAVRLHRRAGVRAPASPGGRRNVRRMLRPGGMFLITTPFLIKHHPARATLALDPARNGAVLVGERFADPGRPTPGATARPATTRAMGRVRPGHPQRRERARIPGVRCGPWPDVRGYRPTPASWWRNGWAGKPRMRCGGGAVVKNEADIIEAFVRHNLGISGLPVVVDNGQYRRHVRDSAALVAEGLPLHLSQDSRLITRRPAS